MAEALDIDVFQGDYKPLPGGPGWDDSTAATWPATTSTLISGGSEALLVDALLTKSEGERLAAWVRSSGRRLQAIFVTHGHADHFFGAGPVQEALPDVALLACDQQVVDEALVQTRPKAMASWNSRFPGLLPQSPPVPTLAAHEFDLGGHALQFHTFGGADGVLATIVHVPELRSAMCSVGGIRVLSWGGLRRGGASGTPRTRSSASRTAASPRAGARGIGSAPCASSTRRRSRRG